MARLTTTLATKWISLMKVQRPSKGVHRTSAGRGAGRLHRKEPLNIGGAIALLIVVGLIVGLTLLLASPDFVKSHFDKVVSAMFLGAISGIVSLFVSFENGFEWPKQAKLAKVGPPSVAAAATAVAMLGIWAPIAKRSDVETLCKTLISLPEASAEATRVRNEIGRKAAEADASWFTTQRLGQFPCKH